MKRGNLATVQTPLFPGTISEREQAVVAQPGSLTLIESPLYPVAKTQCPPLCTFKITILFWSRLDFIALFATNPWKVSPNLLMEAQTNKLPLAQPPLEMSHLLSVDGLKLCPVPWRAMAAELIRHPAWQMVFAEVPSDQLPHLESHCLYMGKLQLAARQTRTVRTTTLNIFIIWLRHILIEIKQIPSINFDISYSLHRIVGVILSHCLPLDLREPLGKFLLLLLLLLFHFL